jgi:Ca2+-binding RTX toxin-like protein
MLNLDNGAAGADSLPIRRHEIWRGDKSDNQHFDTVDNSEYGAAHYLAMGNLGEDGWQGNDLLVHGGLSMSLPANDPFVLDDGNANLWGDMGNDTLVGGLANDNLSGGPGDDMLIGGPGDDTIQGDAGVNTAVYFGNVSDYHITQLVTGGVVIIDTAGPLGVNSNGSASDGVDRVSKVQLFEFNGLGGQVLTLQQALALDGWVQAPGLTDVDPSGARVNVTGTGQAGVKVTLYDFGHKVATQLISAAGTFAFHNVATHATGDVYTAISTDAHGDVSLASAPWTYHII